MVRRSRLSIVHISSLWIADEGSIDDCYLFRERSAESQWSRPGRFIVVCHFNWLIQHQRSFVTISDQRER